MVTTGGSDSFSQRLQALCSQHRARQLSLGGNGVHVWAHEASLPGTRGMGVGVLSGEATEHGVLWGHIAQQA